MNLSTDFVRRAAEYTRSTVGATVSSVGDRMSKSRRSRDGSIDTHTLTHEDVLMNAKEKYNLSLKCTPSKDAITTSSLAIRTGYLMKRNEQGVWHKKYVCSVPHIFLYYFDSDTAEAPKGVIDLELYNSLSVDGNVLKLAPANEDYLRSFYFEDDDRMNLEEWSTSLVRERYYEVCEEKNAYQQMQFEMSCEIDNKTQHLKAAEQAHTNIQKELAAAKKNWEETIGALQGMLVMVGITEEEMMKLSDMKKLSNALAAGIIDLKSSIEKRTEEDREILLQERAEHEIAVRDLLKIIEENEATIKQKDAQILKERKEYEKKILETHAQLQNAVVNIQMVATGKAEAEAKASKLSMHKKILKKEVKDLRSKLEEANSAFDHIKVLNEKLANATLLLQKSPKTVSIDSQENSELSVSTKSRKEKRRFSSADFADNSPEAALAAMAELKKMEEANGVILPDIDGSSPPQYDRKSIEKTSISTEINAEIVSERSSSGSEVKSATVIIAGATSTVPTSSESESRRHSVASVAQSEDSDSRMSWDMPAAELRELSWLSPEQTRMVEKRSQEANKQSHSTEAIDQKKKASAYFSRIFVGGNEESSHEASSAASMKRRFSSLFQAKPVEADKAKEASESTDVHTSEHSLTGMFFTSPFATRPDDPPEDKERLPVSMRLKCLRCQGGVEGPKYSTCRCAMPALTPQELSSPDSTGSANFSRVFRTGSIVAGGFAEAAGGLMKVTSSSVGGIINLAKEKPVIVDDDNYFAATLMITQEIERERMSRLQSVVDNDNKGTEIQEIYPVKENVEFEDETSI